MITRYTQEASDAKSFKITFLFYSCPFFLEISETWEIPYLTTIFFTFSNISGYMLGFQYNQVVESTF